MVRANRPKTRYVFRDNDSCTASPSEAKVASTLENDGWEVLKRGWPDFIAIKGDTIRFLEVKRNDGDKLRPEQVRVSEILSRYGITVERVIPDYEPKPITNSTHISILHSITSLLSGVDCVAIIGDREYQKMDAVLCAVNSIPTSVVVYTGIRPGVQKIAMKAADDRNLRRRECTPRGKSFTKETWDIENVSQMLRRCRAAIIFTGFKETPSRYAITYCNNNNIPYLTFGPDGEIWKPD